MKCNFYFLGIPGIPGKDGTPGEKGSPGIYYNSDYIILYILLYYRP